jgi:poly-gamma-glutamate synthesis protein (capsule biosynthesis protein)
MDTDVPVENAAVWVDDATPPELRAGLQLNGGHLVDTEADGNVHFGVVQYKENSAAWVYALVVPFPTLLDEVSLTDLRQAWRGQALESFGKHGLLMSPQTKAAFEGLWGPAGTDAVWVLPEDQLLSTAWSERDSSSDAVIAIVPFEKLEPRWKVVRIDGASPIDKQMDSDTYPLIVHFGWKETGMQGTGSFPKTNRDESKMTTLVMTGVTALVRVIAARMETKGMTYPGQKIVSWLRDADITHISNEVSFTDKCPPADPNQTTLIFCSRPEYIQLLDYVGADVIELSGNHLLDWRWDALPESFELYQQHNMRYYASGNTPEEARQPLEIDNNGNQFVFIGCNPAGPKTDWVTADETDENTDEVALGHAGTAPCDVDWMIGQIKQFKTEGKIPIVTLQYFENYSMKVQDHQSKYFHQFSDAGAVIVSGSQAHFPQGMEFAGGNFIHYGLGNLFFDQMRLPDYAGVPLLFDEKDLPIAGTRLEYIDRHVFYDGKYMGVELLTAMLDDFSQPRPMTEKERSVFLRDTFTASGW